MKRISIILICMLLCFAACAKTAPAPQPTEAPVVTEQPAAEEPAAAENPPAQTGKVGDLAFQTQTLNGDAIAADIIREYDLIIVNCWAEWCGPCVGELPALEQIHQEYPNVLILGVLVATNSIGEAKETLDEAGVTYPTLQPDGSLEEISTRSMYIPATYFFDKGGKEIGEPIVGGQSYEEWKAVVEGLLS